MTVGAAPGTVLVDVLSDSATTYTVDASGGLSITIPVSSGAILVPQDQL
jgi:hypothetical protein